MSSKKQEDEESRAPHYKEKKTAFEELAEEHGVQLRDVTPMAGIKYCSKCGSANTPDDDRCFNCHSHFEQHDLFGKVLKNLEDDEVEEKDSKQKKSRKKKSRKM